jgi:DNA-binding SARP family transcriptional activator/tetratricopeptide (TPR) repeat protein
VLVTPAVRFALLGPLRAWRTGSEIELGPPQQRLLLAVLLAHAGAPVSLDTLVDVLWEDNPPNSAVNVVHRYVGTLRRIFEPSLPPRAAGSWLVRDGGGYRLVVSAESADLAEFRALTAQARKLVSGGDTVAAIAVYTSAFQLWQGRVAEGVAATPRARAVFTDVDHEGCEVICEAVDTALTCGLVADLVPYLRQAVSMDEYNEAMQARLMLALTAAGNQAAALKTYENIRAKLAEDLGIDPGPELRSALQSVLSPVPAAPTFTQAVRPAQLPPDLPAFAGRRAELKHLESLLGSKGLVTVAIDGMPGSGKTTLAVHWAHSVAGRFPDGQLYVDLRGFDPSDHQLAPDEALRGFLVALGVHPNQIPSTVDEQSALFRTLLSERRVLVLIDNARDADDVRPLLPGTAGSHVIVTSRNRLTELVASAGAHPVTLHALSHEDARETLIRRLGQEKVETESDAVEEIIRLCGRLPLALAIVSARAAANPHFPLSAIITKLKHAKGALGGFRDSDVLDVQAAFSWSYRILSPGAAKLFRLLSLHSGPDISVGSAAALAGLAPCDTQTLLDELTRTRFLTEHEPGRYITHELIRAYGLDQCNHLDSPEDRRAALGRLLDYYLHSSYQAYVHMQPTQLSQPPGELLPFVTPADIPDFAAALDWFNAEQLVLGLLVKTAADNGFHEYSWSLAITLQQFYQRRGLAHEWESTMATGLAAAIEVQDVPGQALMHRSIAGALHMLHRSDSALAHLRRTEELFGQLGYTTEHAYLYSNFGTVLGKMGQYQEAINYHQRALALYELAGLPNGQAISLHQIASGTSKLGDHQGAIQLINNAMQIYASVPDLHGEANCWATLGEVYHNLCDYAEAARCFNVAADIYRQVDADVEVADTLLSLGDTFNAASNHTGATATWRSALAIYERLKLPVGDEVRARLNAVADTIT